MTPSAARSVRPLRPLLALAVALLAALAVVALRSDRPAAAASASQPVPQSQLVFRQDMRRLWEEHVTWTRLAIVSFAAGLPDLPQTEARLLRNQTDIGQAVAPYYGEGAAQKLTALLRQHILEAVDVLAAAKAGDAAALQKAQHRWYRNADTIAGFLHRANPTQWSLEDMRAMMHRHLALTTAEAVARLQGRYHADIAAYDRVEEEILEMADMLSTGIIAQFPDRFQ